MATRRAWLCRVLPLFNKANCFVSLPQVAADGLKEEGGLLGVVVVELHGSGGCTYATWDHSVQPRSEDGGNEIGVPVNLMQQMGLQKGDQIQIRVTPRAGPEAKGVFVEPASVDDSEIVEHNATRLEDLILRQLRIAYDGLVFPIVVRHGIHVMMKVERIEAPSGSPYVILGDGSELYVKTMTRQQKTTENPPLSALLRTTEPKEGTSTVSVSRALCEKKRWVEGAVLPCLSFTSLVSAASEAVEAKSTKGTAWTGTPSEAALRRIVFDVTISIDNSNDSSALCTPSADLGIIRGSRILIDPSMPSSGVHESKVSTKGCHKMRSLCAKVHPTAWTELQSALQMHIQEEPRVESTLKGGDRSLLSGVQGNVLVTAAGGCGKSFVVNALMGAMQCHATQFDPQMLLEEYLHADAEVQKAKTKTAVLLAGFRKSLAEASLNAPSVLFIDNLEVLLSGKAGTTSPTADANADMLVSMFASGCNAGGECASLASQWAARMSGEQCGGVTIVATAASVEALPVSIVKLFATVVKLALPNQEQRRAILKHCLSDAHLSVEREGSGKVSLAKLSRDTNNHTPRDLATLVIKAAHHARISRPDIETPAITSKDIEAARHEYTPASLSGTKQADDDETHAKGWSIVGGMDEAKRVFNEVVILPTKYPELYKNLPVKMRSGILLYGPTGCGKSHIIRAAVQEAGITCIEVAGPELLNKYIGQSEQKVREVFEQAAAAAPCVLFFDEFDSIAPQRGHDNTGVTDRVVNQLLCHLDGAEGRSGVYVVAATARPDLIDKALLRPGRLDASIYCGMPTPADRTSVLKASSHQLSFDDTVDLQEISDKAEGYTQADLAALLSTARLRCMQQVLQTSSMLAGMNVEGGEENTDKKESTTWSATNTEGKAYDEVETYVGDLGLLAGGVAGGKVATPVVPKVSQQILLEAFKQSRASISKYDAERNAKRYASYQEARSGGGAKDDKKKGQRTTMA